jgi:hypothetical protein
MFLDLAMAASIEYVSKTCFSDNAPKALLFPDDVKMKRKAHSSGKHVKRPQKRHSRGPGSVGLELPNSSLKPALVS